MSTPRLFIPSARWRWQLAVGGMLAVLSGAVCAQEAAKRSFNLPSDLAAATFKLFAGQSGRGLIADADLVRDVRTNAVKGEFTPRDAVDRMIAGTGLVAKEDSKNGAFVVHRVRSPQNGGNAPAGAPPVSKKKSADAFPRPQENMKTKSPVTRLAGLFAFVVATDPLSAQSAAPPANESVIELSPFIVDSTRDTGYQATSTLAGTRLKTDLKDLGAAISVYTKDFLDDIGAVDSADFLIYATGMDAAGMGGNYSGALNDLNAEGISTNQREQLQSPSRVRGLATPTYTRNFFNSLVPIDSYNTEQATVVRGPNSALVGVSSPGGIVDTSLAQADLKRNRNQVAFRYGNNDSMRATVDINRALIPDKLAARLIGLHNREEYNQRPAYEEKKRLYGALSYQPFKSTLLRVNFETGNGTANRPIPTLPQNSISDEWYNAGRPVFDWTFYDDPARNPLAASQVVNNNLIPYFSQLQNMQGTGHLVAIYNNPDDRSPSSIIQSNVPTTAGTLANAIRNGTFHPLLNRDLAADSTRFVTTRNITEFAPGIYWVGENVLPGQQPGFQPPGLKQQSFTDFSAFDWKNRMIDESSLFTHSFHSSNVTLSQTAWQNRLGVELAYDKQRMDNRAFASFLNGNGFRNTQVRVDMSVTLPNGLPNPNVGRPMLVSENFRHSAIWQEYETGRATAFLKYDFKDLSDSWGRRLGRHTLGGVIERFQHDRIPATNTRLAFTGPNVDQIGANILSNILNNIVYLGPSLVGNNNPLQLNPIKVGQIVPGPVDNVSTFVREAGTTDPGGFVESPASLHYVVLGARAFREVIKSRAVTLQSNWLDNHVATVFGWRRDVDYNDNFSFNWVDRVNRGEVTGPRDPGVTAWNFDEIDLPSTPQKLTAVETKSYSVVLNWPRKLFQLPAGTDLSVFYSESDNFTPVGIRTDEFGRRIPEPKGTTKEFGFGVSTFNNKLVLRANRFVNEVERLGFLGASGTPAVLRTIQAIARWSVEGNTNPQMVPSRNADIEKLKAVLPPGVLDIYQFRVEGTAPNIEAIHEAAPPTGRGDTTDFTAKGVELEVVYNPTQNWRILANVARQETVQSNVLPVLREAVALFGPVWAELADRPWGSYPLGHQPGDPLSPNVQTLGDQIDVIHVNLASDLATVGLPSPEQRKWRVNLVTNYRFGPGSIFGERLRGWSVGGGVRWQSKFTLGFPSFRTADGVPGFDITNPYYAPADINVDAFVRYSRKIWADRIDWRMQLNVRNLYKERDLLPMQVQPWGQTASMRLAPERRWYLTNTFTF